MAVAFTALLAALSGTAVALPGTGSVDSGDLRNNTVRSKDLRNNDVRSGDIRNGSVSGGDLRDNSVTGADVDESSLSTVPSAGTANSATTATTATDATTATNATQLGGVAASSYQRTADLLFGTITTSGGGATVVAGRSRGVTGATRVGTGFYEVAFDRDVSNCTWLATGGNVGIGTPPYIATTRAPVAGSPANEIGVVIFNDAGGQVDGASVFVSVLCP